MAARVPLEREQIVFSVARASRPNRAIDADELAQQIPRVLAFLAGVIGQRLRARSKARDLAPERDA